MNSTNTYLGPMNITPKIEAKPQTLERKHETYRNHMRRRNLPLKEVIQCNCGNKIKIFRNNGEFKCFSCEHYFHKVNGEWIKAACTVKKDTLTIGDLGIKIISRKTKA